MSEVATLDQLYITYPTILVYANELTPYPGNYQNHPAEQVRGLAESLTTFQQFKPIVVWRCAESETLADGLQLHEGLLYIICGHGLWQGAMEAGVDRLEAKDISGVSRETAEAILWADNASVLGSEPIPDKLAALLERTRGMTADKAGLGAMLQALKAKAGINGNGHEAKDAGPQLDKAAELQKVWGVQVGDVWELGQHRLVCGDCTDRATVEAVMRGERAEAVIADPPYGMKLNVDYRRGKDVPYNGASNANTKAYSPVMGDDLDFDPRPVLEMFKDTKEQYWFGADYYAKRLPDGGSWLVWDKRYGVEDMEFDGSSFELCWSMTKHNRDIIRCRWSGILGMESQDTKVRIHPTQKPLEVIQWIIEHRTKTPGSLLVDPYLGSGTTIIAAENLGRKVRAIELDPSYCSVALQRFIDAGGQTPRRVSG